MLSTQIKAMGQPDACHLVPNQGMDVIVVTNALTQSGIMGRLKNDVDGTGAKFNDTGLMQNPLFSDWISAAVEENLS